MKKILSIVSALAVVLAIASCGSENKKENDKENDGKVTQVVFGGDNPTEEEGDTSAEAIEFLKENQSYFYENFFSKRNHIPLAYISSTKGEEEVITEVYVKDEDTMAIVGNDALGRKTRIIYDKDKAYQVYDEEKKLYKKEYDAETIKTAVENTIMKQKYSVVSQSSYSFYDKDYEGKTYNCSIISAYNPYAEGVVSTEYYFDKETNEIKYIISQDVVSEVKLLSNEIPDESVFDIPSDYEEDTVEKLNEEIMEELSKAQENAE